MTSTSGNNKHPTMVLKDHPFTEFTYISCVDAKRINRITKGIGKLSRTNRFKTSKKDYTHCNPNGEVLKQHIVVKKRNIWFSRALNRFI